MFWTEARVSQLVKLREKGLSAGRIAEEMGASRNAVIGKLARLAIPSPRVCGNFSGPGTLRRGSSRPAAMPLKAGSETISAKPKGRPSGGGAVVHQARRARERGGPLIMKPPKRAMRAEAEAFDTARLAEAVSLADLDAGQCRFAVTPDEVAPAGHRFCGLDVADRFAGPNDPQRSYCRHHLGRIRSANGRMGE